MTPEYIRAQHQRLAADQHRIRQELDELLEQGHLAADQQRPWQARRLLEQVEQKQQELEGVLTRLRKLLAWSERDLANFKEAHPWSD